MVSQDHDHDTNAAVLTALLYPYRGKELQKCLKCNVHKELIAVYIYAKLDKNLVYDSHVDFNFSDPR